MRRFVLPLALMAVTIGILIALPPASYAFRSDVGPGGSSRTLTLPEEARAVTYDVANAAPELNAFRRRVGGVWAMARNPETGTAHAVWGSGLEFPSARGAAPAVLEAIGRRFIDENPDLFGVSSRDLSVLSVRTRAGKTSIIFQQRWQDVPVWGARVHVVFHESGRIVAFGSDARRGIAADVQPGLDRPAAYRRAGNWLEIRDGGRELGAELWIVPTGGKDRLAWRTLVGEGPGQAAWALLVDAHDGTILTSQQLSYHADVAGAVSGSVDWLTPCDGPQQNRPFSDLLVNLDVAGSGYTDAAGFFTIPTDGEDPVNATLMLRGRYADVRDSDGDDAVITQLLEPGGIALIEWQDTNSTPAERDVYAFTNEIRRVLLGVDPEFITQEYNFALKSVVNVLGTFTASWNWNGGLEEWMSFSSENLSTSDPTQNAGRMADVVYHEFGHSLTFHVYGPANPWPNLSLHEGNSDVIAALLTQDPLCGRGYIISDCGSFRRTADNTLQYPNDYNLTDGHLSAPILSGVYWDAYDYLRTHGSTGDEARNIVLQFWHDGRMLGLPFTYPDQLYWTYIADDDDGNLANGTPHSAAIDFGSTNHGFQSLNELVAAQGLFADVTTPALELPFGAGTAWGDYDGDGDFDLFVTSNSSDSSQASRLLRNDGGTFVDVTPEVLALNTCLAAAWGDFDNDGDQDLAVAHSVEGGLLFRNSGGVFTDITPAAFATATTNASSASWVDYDMDGDLDLYLASTLYRNDGGGAFSAVAGQPLSETGQGQVMASAWTDYDRDGDSDVFLARVDVPCLLIRNNGNGTFTDVTPTVLQIPEGAMAAAWGDYDNDGDPDLATSGSSTGMKTRLFHYDGGTTFTEIIESDLNGSLGGCVEWADYDCDGRLDLYVSGLLTNTLLHNDGGNAFTDRSADPIWNAAWGVSAGWADYDGDGDLDVYLGNLPSSPSTSVFSIEQGCRLLRNENATGNGWLEVDLVGTVSNHDGVGARLKLETNAGFYYRQGEGGGGHATQNARRVHFGIGASTSIKGLKVTWPSGKVSSVTGIARNSRITVIEPTAPLPPTPHQTVSNAGFAPRLLAVSPNPWRDETAIRFSLARADAPVIRIYDVSGRRVREGVLGELPGGIHEWAWDGRDDCGNLVVGGIYFLRFQTPGHTETMRMVKLGR